MSTWKHRDSELDRTCGRVVPVAREYRGKVSEPFCRACDGEVYKVEAEGGDEVAREWARNGGKGYFGSEAEMRDAYNRREAEGGEA